MPHNVTYIISNIDFNSYAMYGGRQIILLHKDCSDIDYICTSEVVCGQTAFYGDELRVL